MKNELMATQMSRKEFLRIAAVVLLGAMGVTNFITNIRNQLGGVAEKRASERRAGRGFGASKFGV